jgi:hypothetical protein
MGEGAVDAGGSSEVGAERFEGGCVRYALGAAFWLRSVMSAELGRRCFALASISKGELATVGVEFVRRLVGGCF